MIDSVSTRKLSKWQEKIDVNNEIIICVKEKLKSVEGIRGRFHDCRNEIS